MIEKIEVFQWIFPLLILIKHVRIDTWYSNCCLCPSGEWARRCRLSESRCSRWVRGRVCEGCWPHFHHWGRPRSRFRCQEKLQAGPWTWQTRHCSDLPSASEKSSQYRPDSKYIDHGHDFSLLRQPRVARPVRGLQSSATIYMDTNGFQCDFFSESNLPKSVSATVVWYSYSWDTECWSSCHYVALHHIRYYHPPAQHNITGRQHTTQNVHYCTVCCSYTK